MDENQSIESSHLDYYVLNNIKDQDIKNQRYKRDRPRKAFRSQLVNPSQTLAPSGNVNPDSKNNISEPSIGQSTATINDKYTKYSGNQVNLLKQNEESYQKALNEYNFYSEADRQNENNRLLKQIAESGSAQLGVIKKFDKIIKEQDEIDRQNETGVF